MVRGSWFVAALLLSCSSDPEAKPRADGGAGQAGTAGTQGSGGTSGGGGGAVRYDQAVFSSTHNSYEGTPGDELGSLASQLDRGVRFVELDVHDNDFETLGYRIGHDAPGDAALGNGNPETPALSAWLAEIATWSALHPGHAPITIGLDLKDSLVDNPSYADGNLAALNAELENAFGPRLLREESMGETFPTLDELRDRFVAVLSGHEGSRLAYRRDRGNNPAVAIDSAGRVVEVHDSGSGELWYWTGARQADGTVRFHRHARYDTGTNPCVAISDSGIVVEVHEDPDFLDDQLWYRIGRLDSSFEIVWGNAQGLPFPNDDEGKSPSVRFVAEGAVKEIHESATTGQRWYWNGAIDASALSAVWTRNASDSGQTSAPSFDATTDTAAGRTVTVTSSSFGPFDNDTLVYFTELGGPWPIRYQQLMFVEAQYGGAAALEADARFVAASAQSSAGTSWALGWQAQGRPARLWQFHDGSVELAPAPSFPATDFPNATWYAEYCQSIGCVMP